MDFLATIMSLRRFLGLSNDKSRSVLKMFIFLEAWGKQLRNLHVLVMQINNYIFKIQDMLILERKMASCCSELSLELPQHRERWVARPSSVVRICTYLLTFACVSIQVDTKYVCKAVTKDLNLDSFAFQLILKVWLRETI